MPPRHMAQTPRKCVVSQVKPQNQMPTKRTRPLDPRDSETQSGSSRSRSRSWWNRSRSWYAY